MLNKGLPTVDVEYVEKLLNDCPKIEGTFQSGDTKGYVVRGNSAIAKRMFFVRCVDPKKTQVTFDCAMGIAIKTKQIQELKDWLQENRNFNHG